MSEELGLSFGHGSATSNTKAEEQNGEYYGDDYCDDDDDEKEEELPLISIELERLVGYKPSTTEELDSIRNQLMEAMWDRFHSSSETGNVLQQQEEEKDGPPPDFDDQIKELLDSKVASFGRRTTTTQEDETDSKSEAPFLEISYPSILLFRNNNSSSNNNDNSDSWKDTAQVWNDIRNLAYALEEYDSYYYYDDDDEIGDDKRDFWYRLCEHLECTGRVLVWKHSMAMELRDCLEKECLYKNHNEWISEQRKAKLEQLYQVRETLVHLNETARKDYDRLLFSKQDAIRKDMLVYDHQQKRSTKTTEEAAMTFPEEFQLLGLLPKDPLYEEEDWGGTLDDDDDFDYYQSDYSDEFSSGEDDDDDDYAAGDEDEHDNDTTKDDDDNKPSYDFPPNNDTTTTTTTSRILPVEDGSDVYCADHRATTIPKPFLRKNRERRKKKAKAQKKKEREEAIRRDALLKRQAHERILEQKHTTQELILAQTLLNGLNNKVSDVEELLETLQDEVWQAEEEEDQHENTNTADNTLANNNNNTVPLSLLDQVLAMILGALPVGKRPVEEHFRYIKEEHDFIVNGWKEYFGRLPPAFVPGKKTTTTTTLETDRLLEYTTTAAAASTATTKISETAPPTTVKLSKIARRRNSRTLNQTRLPLVTPQERRIALGIVDNEDGNWDDDDENKET